MELIGWILLVVPALAPDEVTQPASPKALEILEQNCLECHQGASAKGKLDLSSRASILKGGESGPSLIERKASESLLYRRAAHLEEPAMPYQRDKLKDSEIEALRDWIDAGAPLERTLVSKSVQWWSLRPITQPEIPKVQGEFWEEWSKTPIDWFIAQKLAEKKLLASPEASRSILIRRVYYDLTGLPPTPEEVDKFVHDPDPQAYEKLVDQLLASPRYGERWARHWMDLVHYAETHGHDQDRPRDHAWPYRDYLIRSFNEDKAYQRFVREQIAGDILWPEDPSAIVATGFLATGPWDESSLRDIREDTIDREIARYIDRDDVVTTVMSTFTSTTVHCARCHDHKFDPVAQSEYYALQAVFSGIDKANRSYDLDPATASRRRELEQLRAALPMLMTEKSPRLKDPALLDEVAAWEKGIDESSRQWIPIDSASYQAQQGSTLTPLEDGSVLASGTRPEKETCQINFTYQGSLTGFRLDVLSDESLPMKGPGRQDNGNLHLNEVRITQIQEDGSSRVLPIAVARADFNQAGWTIEHSLDGNPATAWGIYPEVGKPHVAVFGLKEPEEFPKGSKLQITLEQVHGGGHLIGKFRISTTSKPLPTEISTEVLPIQVTKALAKPAGERTEEERDQLAAFVLSAKVARELGSLPARQMVYCGTNQFQPDGSFKPTLQPRPVQILKRGDIRNPLGNAQPGALNCVPASFVPPDIPSEGGSRVALANWLVDRENVFTWRSIVNRLWHHHFGKGIVDSPNDFGRMGGKPSHPELLDWLAWQLQENGGSLKSLHRLMVTSAAYRQSTDNSPERAALDGENRLLWRANRTRLDAESIRDSIVQFTGKLDLTMGGPSVRQFNMSPGIHVTPNVDYAGFDMDRPENYRRSVYRFVFRTLPDPFMETMDCPDSAQLTPVRQQSVTALQALSLLNNPFVVRTCDHMAARIESKQSDPQSQVAELFQLILLRKPEPKELARLSDYRKKFGLANTARILINSNEFLFVE